MPLRPITSKEQHKQAIDMLIEIGIKDRSMNKDERDYLRVLSDLVAQYEKLHLPARERSSPQEILQFLMEQHGLKQADIVHLVGYKSNLSAFLAGRRNLSKASATNLGKRFNVDPMLFLPRL
jgi:HTH-type transcriptional regulator/antitoxin HigA